MNIQSVRAKKQLVINQHSNSRRIALALKLKYKHGFKLPLYADTMSNEFLNKYDGWPLQVLFIYKNSIQWNIPPKRSGSFDFNDLKSALHVHQEIAQFP